MPKVTINGNTFEAETQEQLDKAIEIYGRGSAASTSTNSGKRAKPEIKFANNGGGDNKPPEVTQMSLDDFKKAIQSSPSTAIMQALNEALGFDLKKQLGQLAVAAGSAWRDTANTAAALALKEQGLKADDKTVEEFLNIAQQELGRDFTSSITKLRGVAKTAKENEWFAADPDAKIETTSANKADNKSTNKEGEPKEQNLDSATKNDLGVVEDNLSDDSEKIDPKKLKELEKAVAEMDDEEFFATLSQPVE